MCTTNAAIIRNSFLYDTKFVYTDQDSGGQVQK